MPTAAIARTRPTIIVAAPARRAPVTRRARAGAVARRAARRGVAVARASAVPAGTMLGAAALGYAQAKGMLNRIPTIGGSRALTIAIAGYALTRMSSNRTARDLGRTAMIIGAFDWGSKQGGGKSSLEGDDLDGDFLDGIEDSDS